jgi:hypothetical protein
MKKITKNTPKEEKIIKNEEVLVENTIEMVEEPEIGEKVILEQSDIDEHPILKEAKFQAGDIGVVIPEEEPEISIYKKSTRSGKICKPCSFDINGEILTPEEAVTEGLLTEAEMLEITK